MTLTSFLRVIAVTCGIAEATALAEATELVSVLEAFDDPAEAFNVFGPPPAFFSPGRLDIASADGSLRLAYDYEAPTGGGPAGNFVERYSNGSCAGATHLLLTYRVLNASTLSDAVHLRLGVQTAIPGGAERRLQQGPPSGGPPGGGPPGGGPGDVEPLAFFLWGEGFVLDEATGEWQELLVELCSGGQRAVDPFIDIGRTGTILDAGVIRRWRIGVGIHASLGQTARGTFLVDELSCVRDPNYSHAPGNCTAAPGTSTSCSAVSAVHFDIASPRARNRGFKPRQCCAECAADPTCLYYTTDATLGPPARFPSCYFFDELRPEDVNPAGADVGGEVRADPLASGWILEEQKRGAMCDVCVGGVKIKQLQGQRRVASVGGDAVTRRAQVDGAVSCRGRNLIVFLGLHLLGCYGNAVPCKTKATHIQYVGHVRSVKRLVEGGCASKHIIRYNIARRRDMLRRGVR